MGRCIIVIMVTLVITCQQLFAQELKPSSGKVEVVQDAKITQLAEQYRKMSINNPNIDGYRIQIFFDSGNNSKNKANSVKGEFEAAYPEVKAYLSYKEPYYRIRVGNFRTELEAIGFQKKIAADYPNAFPVKDEILP